jgi:hypothetical protein
MGHEPVGTGARGGPAVGPPSEQPRASHRVAAEKIIRLAHRFVMAILSEYSRMGRVCHV